MNRVALTGAALATVICAFNGGLAAARAQQDSSAIDPWVQQVDTALQSGDTNSAWAAIKAVFPDDYAHLVRDMASAMLQGADATILSQTFIQSHLSDQIHVAKQAPADQQLSYQKKKADFLFYLAPRNPEACAFLSSGIGDASTLATMADEQVRRYSDLMATTIETIGAGRDAPVTHGAVTMADVSAITAIMAAQGVSDSDAEKVLSGQVGNAPAELCRMGVIRNAALAAAPADIVAKLAFQ